MADNLRHDARMIAILPATDADAPAIAEIYAHYVVHGTATFEIVPPDAAEIAARMGKVRAAGWPWLVARDADGGLVGYAYAGQFRERVAYRDTVENAIYIAHDRLGQGIGKRLLAALIEACEAFAPQGPRQMIAVIAGSEPASIALHARAGFVEVGHLKAVGRKHGQWLDVVYMQRALGPGDGAPPGVEPA